MAPICSCDYAPTLTLSREALWRRSLHWLALNHDEKNQIHWPGLLLNAGAGGGSCENMPAWIRKLTQTSLAGPLLRPKAQGSLSGNCSRISIDELDPCPEGACHVRLSQNKKKLNMSQSFRRPFGLSESLWISPFYPIPVQSANTGLKYEGLVLGAYCTSYISFQS